MSRKVTLFFITLVLIAVPFAVPAQPPSRSLVRQRIDESRLTRLKGNTRPEANAANDRGRVADNFAMDHMLLQLRRAPEQQQALDGLIDSMHDPKSPSFHRWLTPDQFASQFGASPQDVHAVTAWLEGHGFKINAVYPHGLLVDFSGNAGQIRQAFHTEIHALNVRGERHVANMSDPMIPEALRGAIAGVVSLHDFQPHALARVTKAARTRPEFTLMGGPYVYEAVTPGDLATIYNLNPLFASGQVGTGQTIALIEDADLFTARDWEYFRSTFGLDQIDQHSTGSLTTVHPAGATLENNCATPGIGVIGDDSESTLDVEWSSAAAPGAAIELVSCASTRTTWGGMIAIENLINGPNPPPIMSISFGDCEPDNTYAGNLAFSLAYQQAVAEGISVFVASGDAGAASCDAFSVAATHGIAVSGFASTPYNVAVGGTDFGDSVAGTNLSYWSSSNNGNFTSALSYVPEIPWNDSCASSLLAGYFGYKTTYGQSGFCGSSTGQNYYTNVAAGGGGPSNCATGFSADFDVADGTCQGNPKPNWQSAPGVPNDGVRDLPDVSSFAADGIFGHYLVFCWSNVDFGGALCTGDPGTWSGGGGTSFAAPVMAGIQALVNAHAGGPQGNPNYIYYKLASTNSCNASNGDSGVSTCVFHNITQGDIAVNCGGAVNCFGASVGRFKSSIGATNGALSASPDKFTPAFSAGPGWNFATGNGSVNAYNLVNLWNAAQIPASQ